MRIPTAAAVALVALAACAGASDDAVVGEEDLQQQRAPEVLARLDGPFAELSGLALREVAGRTELLTVGDSAASLGVSSDEARFESRALPGVATPSQLEAVATDATGRVFALEESPGAIHAFDAAVTKRTHRITLDYGGKKTWDDPNSRGEGFVLLASGHVLVLKEKAPTLIAEMGPEGDEPRGYAPGDAAGTFPLPPGVESRFVVLTKWEQGDATARSMTDASDLAVGPLGRLYVLSDQSRTVSRIEERLKVSETRFKATAVWALPKEIDKPEGLAFMSDGRVAVASDQSSPGRSVFLLSALR